MLSLSMGLNYMSCTNSLDVIKILIENLINSNLKKESHKFLLHNHYKQAGLLNLMMGGFQNKVALENFLILYERSLKYLTIP